MKAAVVLALVALIVAAQAHPVQDAIGVSGGQVYKTGGYESASAYGYGQGKSASSGAYGGTDFLGVYAGGYGSGQNR